MSTPSNDRPLKMPTHGFTRAGHAVHATTMDHMPVETRKQRFDKSFALLITKTVGSMNCAYAFAVLALLSLPAVLSQFGTFAHTFPAWMIKASVISLIAWIAQTFLQLVLLSVIMVGQSVQSAAADVRASKTFEDTEKIVDALRIDTEGGLGIIYTRIGELEHAVIGVRRLLGDQPNDYKAPTSVTVSSVRNEKTRKHPKPKETS